MHVDAFDSDDATEVADGVFLQQLAVGEKLSVQGFRIEPGAAVPEHSHPQEQSGTIHAGTLTFVRDGDHRTVGPGESYVIPGGEPHAAVNEGDEAVTGIDVFSPPRPDPDWA